MKAHVLRVLSGLGYVAAMEVCMSCRPVELQIAPGVGIDLTMAYGTVAINFRNGTILDLGKIDGSPTYRWAMKTLAVDALGVRDGEPSRLPREPYIQPKPPMDLFPIFPMLLAPRLLFKYLVQQLRQRAPILRPRQLRSTDPWIIAVAEMLSGIKSLIQSVEPPITHDLVIISYPDFEADTGHIYVDRFLIACEQAGLEGLGARSTVMSRAALQYYDIEDCRDDVADPRCDDTLPGERVERVLTVTYNAASLGTTLLSRWQGMLLPVRVGENFNHGAGVALRSTNAVRYWEEVSEFIRKAIADNTIDRLMLLGSHATNSYLVELISEALETSGNSEAWGRHSARSRTVEEQLFAPATGAARTARSGMVDEFIACLVPERCERPDEGSADAVARDGKPEL